MHALHPRYVWPKISSPLTEQERDFRRLDALLARGLSQALRFNRKIQPHLPIDTFALTDFRTIEIGAGLAGHLEFEDLSRQDYHCVELRENMSAELETTSSCQDRLPYSDGYSDRALAVHVLEFPIFRAPSPSCIGP